MVKALTDEADLSQIRLTVNQLVGEFEGKLKQAFEKLSVNPDLLMQQVKCSCCNKPLTVFFLCRICHIRIFGENKNV